MNESINKGNWVLGKENPFFEACRDITNNEALFSNFKTHPIFTQVIGNDVRSKHVSDACFEKIKQSPLLSLMETFKTNDKYGGPKMYHYEGIGDISPGTLYFVHLLQDMITKLGDIKGKKIVEIGSGYGGQAKIILDYGVNSYTCIDVKPALSLCIKYLNLFGYTNVNYIEVDELETSVIEADFVISNWCLSEFDEAGIQYYIENVISKCSMGYFLMNCWDARIKDFIIQTMKTHFSSVEVFPEEIATHHNKNFLLCVKKL